MIFLLILISILAIFLITKGSDWLTDSLMPVAEKLGTSYIAVTTLLASFMMSVPELFIVIYSYGMGHSKIGIGVILGSVMINIGLTVGLSALIKPHIVEKNVVIRDGIFLIVVAIIVMLFGSNLQYERTEGIILLLLFIPYALNVWIFEKGRPYQERPKKIKDLQQNLDLVGGDNTFLKLKPSLTTFVLGALVLVFGSYMLSYVLVKFTEILPFPELFIGLFFGAIGTGAPNIAAAIQGTIKGYKDAAITETFGSNIFTLLVTLGVLIIISPFSINPKVFYFDLTWMICIHLLLLVFIFKGYTYKEESLTRLEGGILVLFYLSLLVINFIWFQ